MHTDVNMPGELSFSEEVSSELGTREGRGDPSLQLKANVAKVVVVVVVVVANKV